MVDFKKLRESKNQSKVIEPVEIFRRLPKPPGINDLYVSQAQTLEEWFKRRNERDIVIKLHTGGGKTLVGLLIASSILNEHNEPVIYLAATVQLVQQTLEKAREYGISAVAYEKGTDFPDNFFTGKSVLICTYQALFNARSRFGVRGGNTPLEVAAIILDDAHVAFSTMREIFTLRVDRDKEPDSYAFMTNMFRNDFDELGKIGTFDDIASGIDANVLEVPYWSWKTKSNQVRDFLRKQHENYTFVWSFLRDNFDYCHCLISKNSLVITPIFPLVDLVPTFEDCPRRIFMSATISDDSAIVRTFDAKSELISNSISSNSLAGVSERMILTPELMPIAEDDLDDLTKMLNNMAEWAAKKLNFGAIFLVPSSYAAKQWEDSAQFAESSEKVTQYVNELRERKSCGPFIFANRYDGIDLPGPACRLLILSGLPRGSSEYDRYRANAFAGGTELGVTLAQRIEQGLGRGARGSGDFCIIITTGNDLNSWLGKTSNHKYLTKSTRAQLDMGIQVSKDISDKKDLHDTINLCLMRDREWVEYHAETLADMTGASEDDCVMLEQAAVERKAFRLLRDKYFEPAISKLEKYYQEAKGSEKHKLDLKSKGWLKQFAARIAYYWTDEKLSKDLQRSAYSDNFNLLCPQVIPPYISLTVPGKQAEAIVSKIFDFNPRRAYLAHFDEVVSHLVAEASANQFEDALSSLGSILGFRSERPDRVYKLGPDVLWLFTENLGLVIEVKSRKDKDNALDRKQHGQLLNAVEWFKQSYPNYDYLRILAHPNDLATRSTVTNQTQVLTFKNLNRLVCNTRKLLNSLCESAIDDEDLVIRCEQYLASSTLKPKSLVEEYLVSFESEQTRT